MKLSVHLCITKPIIMNLICGKCTELVGQIEPGLAYCDDCGVVEGCVDLDPGNLIYNRYDNDVEGWNDIQWENLHVEFDVVINHTDDFEIELLLVLDGEGDEMAYDKKQIIELIENV